MNATNAIKNTIIITLSITTTIGIAQLAAENASLKNQLAAKPETITRTVTQTDPYKLTPCTTDDDTQHNCIWQATDRGNDRGMTYMVDNNGSTWYRDDEILDEMIGWSDQD